MRWMLAVYAVVTMSGMSPGDKTTAPLTVQNTGTLQLRYALTNTTTENGLAAQLQLTIRVGVTTCTNAGFSTDGSAVSGPTVLGSIAGTNIFGDPTQGAQSGDRTLNAGASEVLCI